MSESQSVTEISQVFLSDKSASNIDEEEYDQPGFPFLKRTLKDRTFVLIFLFFLASMVSLAFYSVYTGDPGKFSQEYDSWGNVCGRKNNAKIPGVSLSGMDMSNRTFVLRTGTNNIRAVKKPDILLYSSPPAAAVLCVNKCPTAKITDCRKFVEENGYYVSETIIREYVCVMLLEIILSQTTELNRCIPRQLLQIFLSNSSDQAFETYWDKNTSLSNATENNLNFENYKRKKEKCRLHIESLNSNYALVLISILCSFLFLFSFLQFPMFSIYLTAIILFAASAFFFILLVINSINLREEFVDFMNLSAIASEPSPADSEIVEYVQMKFPAVTLYRKENKAIALNGSLEDFNASDVYVSTYNSTNLFSILTIDGLADYQYILLTTFLIAILVWWQSWVLFYYLEKYLGLLQLTKHAVTIIFRIPYIWIYSLLHLLLLSIVWVNLFVVLGYLFTINVYVTNDRGFVDYHLDKPEIITVFSLLYLLLSIWIWNFVTTCIFYALAYTISSQIFYQGYGMKSNKPNTFALHLNAFKTLIQYHLGAVTIESLFITFIEPTKIFISFFIIKYKLQKKLKSKNLIFLQYGLTRNFIIYTVMFGTSTRKSVKRWYTLLEENNRLLLDLSNEISFFMLSLRSGIVTFVLMAVFCYFKLLLVPAEIPQYFYIILWYVGLFTYNVSQCAFCMLAITLDTLVLCYCDDIKKNNGSNKPYYLSKDIRHLFSQYFLVKEILVEKKLSAKISFSYQDLQTTEFKKQ